MINLLSDSKKSEIRAARANTILVRYIAVLLVALVFTAGVFAFSYQTLKSLDESAQEQLSSIPGGEAQQKPDPILLERISSEVSSNYQMSTILAALATATPKDTVMRKISITAENLRGSPLSLVFYSKPNVQTADVEQSLSMTSAFTIVDVSEGDSSTDVAGFTKKFTVTVTSTGGAL